MREQDEGSDRCEGGGGIDAVAINRCQEALQATCPPPVPAPSPSPSPLHRHHDVRHLPRQRALPRTQQLRHHTAQAPGGGAGGVVRSHQAAQSRGHCLQHSLGGGGGRGGG